MKITFLGAAECVTGSKYLVEHGRRVFLIDAGLYQERDLLHRNWDAFPISPSKIHAVLLTHAHIDHCGYLPKLVKDGFRGKIYCTAATKEIAKLALIDSANLQEADAAYKLKRHKREGRQGRFAEVPLYTEAEARKVFPYFRRINYEEPLGLFNDLTVTFYDAGHILGSAMIELKETLGGTESVTIFSGDIGRRDKPILKDPHLFSRADNLVMEATYGDRQHEDLSRCVDKLARVINETASRGGKVIMPAFAINRTQELMFYLGQLVKSKKIEAVPLYVDSPMAIDVTDIFHLYPEDFDGESKKILESERSLFQYPLLHMTRTPEDSKAINQQTGPAIILAGSGMCSGGRIKHHLFHQLSRTENTLVFTGFQAKGTLGRTLLEGADEVRLFGQTVPVRARIEKINGFSAHADQIELLRWVSWVDNPLKKVFLVHAEKSAADPLAAIIRNKFHTEVVVPKYGDVGTCS